MWGLNPRLDSADQSARAGSRCPRNIGCENQGFLSTRERQSLLDTRAPSTGPAQNRVGSHAPTSGDGGRCPPSCPRRVWASRCGDRHGGAAAGMLVLGHPLTARRHLSWGAYSPLSGISLGKAVTPNSGIPLTPPVALKPCRGVSSTVAQKSR